jgi:hypothetical protein
MLFLEHHHLQLFGPDVEVEKNLDFLYLPFATSWKYLVFESPSNNSFTFALWYYFISSSLKSAANLLFSYCFNPQLIWV